MPSKKHNKKRRTAGEDIFGFDLPEFDIPQLEIPPLDLDLDITSGLETEKQIDPNKMPKSKLIEFLASQLSSDQIYRSLIRLGKHKLANEFNVELEFINRKYRKMIAELEGGEDTTVGDKILGVVVEEIITHTRRKLYSLSFKPEDEKDFQNQIEPLLNGIASMIEESLSKFGWKLNVSREYTLPSNERIDLLVSIGGVNIGIEVKYDLNETSKLQRLLGQIDRYVPYLDLLIVISYQPLSSSAIASIKSKEAEKGKPIRIVSPNKVI